MAQQDTLLHVPQKMRRSVRDTTVTRSGFESRFECTACHRSVWRPISVQHSLSYLCNGMSVAQVITGTMVPLPEEQRPPTPDEIIDLLRETLRYQHLHPRFRLRIVAMVRRLMNTD